MLSGFERLCSDLGSDCSESVPTASTKETTRSNYMHIVIAGTTPDGKKYESRKPPLRQ